MACEGSKNLEKYSSPTLRRSPAVTRAMLARKFLHIHVHNELALKLSGGTKLHSLAVIWIQTPEVVQNCLVSSVGHCFLLVDELKDDATDGSLQRQLFKLGATREIAVLAVRTRGVWSTGGREGWERGEASMRGVARGGTGH